MVDPIRTLPFETIVQLFSLLSTTEIAVSTATSKDWRQAILTDPLINKAIDLTKLKHRLDEDQTINLVRRLLSVSTSDKMVGKELRINIDSFTQRFQRYVQSHRAALRGQVDDFGPPQELDFATSRYLELINVISETTQGKLGKLVLETRLGGVSDFEEPFTEVMIQSVRMLDSPKNNLLSGIQFSIPFPIVVESRGGVRDFSVGDEEYDEYTEKVYDSQSFRELLSEIVNFTGHGLTKLRLDLGSFEEQHSLLFQEISKSKGTMEEFGLRSDGEVTSNRICDLVNSFSNLSSLRLLTLLVEAPFSVGPTAFKLKALRLELLVPEIERLDWLNSWVSDELELLELYLKAGRDYGWYLYKERNYNGSCQYLSASTLSSILVLSQSLKHFDLSGVLLFDYHGPPPVLANLELLHVWPLNSTAGQFFASCSMPKLQVFNFNYSSRKHTSEEGMKSSEAGKHFASILARSSSSLEELTMSEEPKVDLLEIEPEALLTAFTKLRTLEISSSKLGARHILSNFSFPKLKRLAISNSSIQPISLFNLLLYSSTSLEEISLFRVKIDFLWGDAIDPSQEKLLLPKVTLMKVDSNIQVVNFLFTKAIFGGLRNLTISTCPVTDSQGFFVPNRSPVAKSLVILLKSNASSLTHLTLAFGLRELDDGLELGEIGISFPNLKHLDVALEEPVDLTQFLLCKCNYNELLRISLSCCHSSLQEIAEFVWKQSRTLESLLICPKKVETEEVARRAQTICFPRLNSVAFVTFQHREVLEQLFSLNLQSFPQVTDEEKSKSIRERLFKIAPKLEGHVVDEISRKILGSER